MFDRAYYKLPNLAMYIKLQTVPSNHAMFLSCPAQSLKTPVATT
jgi:hypothetical protein